MITSDISRPRTSLSRLGSLPPSQSSRRRLDPEQDVGWRVELVITLLSTNKYGLA